MTSPFSFPRKAQATTSLSVVTAPAMSRARSSSPSSSTSSDRLRSLASSSPPSTPASSPSPAQIATPTKCATILLPAITTPTRVNSSRPPPSSSPKATPSSSTTALASDERETSFVPPMRCKRPRSDDEDEKSETRPLKRIKSSPDAECRALRLRLPTPSLRARSVSPTSSIARTTRKIKMVDAATQTTKKRRKPKKAALQIPEVNPELQVEASPVAPILPAELKAVHPIAPESKPSLAGRSKKGDRKTTRFDPTAKVLPSSPPSPGRRVTSPAAPPAASTQIEPPSVVVPPVLVEEATPTDDTIDEQVPTAISEPTSLSPWARFKPSALSTLASPATPSLSIGVDVAAPSLRPKASTNPFDAYSTSGFGAACIPAPRQGYKSYTNAFSGDDAPLFVDVAAESSMDCDVSEGFGLRSYARSIVMKEVDEDEVILGFECILFTLGATGGWVVMGMGNLEVLGPRDQGEARFVMEATDPRTKVRTFLDVALTEGFSIGLQSDNDTLIPFTIVDEEGYTCYYMITPMDPTPGAAAEFLADLKRELTWIA